MKQQKVFFSKDINEELPPLNNKKQIGLKENGFAFMFKREEEDDNKHKQFLEGLFITHWLEEEEDRITFTIEELVEFLSEFIRRRKKITRKEEDDNLNYIDEFLESKGTLHKLNL